MLTTLEHDGLSFVIYLASLIKDNVSVFTFVEDGLGVKPESLMWPLMFSDGLGLLNRFKRGVDTLRKDLYNAFHQQCQ